MPARKPSPTNWCASTTETSPEVLAWRLTRGIYAREALSGYGAARVGSRWNSPGVRIVYASLSRPLAVLEMLVHVSREAVPSGMVLVPIDVPDELILPANPPRHWDTLPVSKAARQFGDGWVKTARSAVLRVPSVVIPAESNLLINPQHPEAGRIQALEPEPFGFDRRLLR
jgi:RES domain-containing protein